MKKLFFILLISSLAAGAVFAELTLVPSFSASAELKFGVDLDGDISTGFESSAKFKAKFTLREKAHEEYGEGDVYGWIKIKDFEVFFESPETDEPSEDAGKLAAAVQEYYYDADGNDELDKGEGVTLGTVSVDNIQYQVEVTSDGENKLYIDLNGNNAFDDNEELKSRVNEVNAVTSDKSEQDNFLKIKWGGIDAHLKFGEMVYLNILSGTFGTSQSKFSDAAIGRTLNRNDQEGGYGLGGEVTSATDGTKIALGLTNFNLGGPATVELGVQSDSTIAGNTDNTYALSVKVDHTIIPDLLTHDLIGIFDLNNETEIEDPNDKTKKISVAQNTYALGYNLTPEFKIGDFGVQIPLGVDFAYYTGEGHKDKQDKIDVGAKFAVRFDWSSMDGSLENEKDTFTDSDAYKVPSGVEAGARFALIASDDTAKKKDAQAIFSYVRLFDDSGDKGIIPILGVEAALDFDYYLAGDLKNVMDLGAGLYVDADLGIVKPFAGIAYTKYNLTGMGNGKETDNATGADSVFKAKVGLDVTSIVDNVTFTLQWQSGNLLLKDNDEVLKDDKGKIQKGDNLGLRLDQATKSKLGQITLGAKISF